MSNDVRQIASENLIFDSLNPRLEPREDGGKWTQTLILEHLAADPRTKTLAKDIAGNGFNPLKRSLVLSSDTDPKRFTVLEGNRRLAAVRLLRDPRLAGSTHLEKAYKELKTGAVGLPMSTECVVVKKRKDAHHWIEVEHGSELDGVGTLRWTTQERVRYQSLLRGGPVRHGGALGMLELLTDTKAIDAKTMKKVPITSFDRLLADPYVRQKLSVEKDELPETSKGMLALVRIVSDLATKAIRVDDIKRKDDRKRYVDAVVANPGAAATAAVSKAKASSATKRNRRDSWHRKCVVDPEFKASITNKRLRAVYNELRGLDSKTYTNAAAVLFRTMLELALFEYVKRTKLVIKAKGNRPTFLERVNAVLADVQARKLARYEDLKTVRISTNAKDHFLSIDAFHDYVHDAFVVPEHKRLVTTWDGYGPFFAAILA